MNKRKEHVIHKAHKLFIEKGYHATSIQDILNHSGISKGSFYNYFASKGELFKAVFTSIHSQLQEELNALLIGEDPSDIDIFTEQIHLMMTLNRENKMLQLIEDVMASNDPELIMFIKQSKFFFLKWVHNRFIHIFSEDKRPYLLDSAILFTGIMQHMLQTCHAMNETITLKQMIDYCVDRIRTIVEEVSTKGIQMLSPDKVHKLIPNSDCTDFFNNELSIATLSLKKRIEKIWGTDVPKMSTYLKLLYFIQEEVVNNKEPRIFLIESALLSLNMCPQINETKEFENYQKVLSKMI
ncbi:TetR/AcrR family transcriptional regulator [Paenibacillus sp. FA6]|uniref:TetR/AcrR family transcriptional regulator n=1 Tax=Paenibacillus sp. FA6 TaxID=3413029 RepID=UPI003F65D54B